MKSFIQIRANRPTTIVELSAWDMVKLLFGREIMIVESNEGVLLRHYHAYVIFNHKAMQE